MKFKAGGSLILIMVLFQWGSPSAAFSEKVKWYDIEAATIHFDVRGSQTGKIIRHFKDWGYQQVEINQTQMNMMGMSLPTNQKTITEGKWITTLDLVKKTATKMKNPMYESMRKNREGKSGVEAGKAYARAMGGHDTGKTAQYAGEKCDIWEMTQMSAQTCVTKDGLAIWFQTNMGGMQMTHIATKIKRGDPGPKEAYEIGTGVELMAPPSREMDELLKKMRQKRRPPNDPGVPGETKAPAAPPEGQMPDLNKLMEMFKPQGGQ
ncbi:MAG: hypothetical protein NPINA01_08670 [Nitrospinaceae bacterium]|nr:MAG: hypothetical protein NPINA01_08670 [Nitrospinaceae bacterium]